MGSTAGLRTVPALLAGMLVVTLAPPTRAEPPPTAPEIKVAPIVAARVGIPTPLVPPPTDLRAPPGTQAVSSGVAFGVDAGIAALAGGVRLAATLGVSRDPWALRDGPDVEAWHVPLLAHVGFAPDTGWLAEAGAGVAAVVTGAGTQDAPLGTLGSVALGAAMCFDFSLVRRVGAPESPLWLGVRLRVQRWAGGGLGVSTLSFEGSVSP